MFGARSMVDVNKHDADPYRHQIASATGIIGSRGSSGAQLTILAPHAIDSAIPVLHAHVSQFPNGITITDFAIGISAGSAGYTVTLWKYTSPTDGSPVSIESVATVGVAQEAEDDGTIDSPDLDAGDWVYAALPTTVMSWCQILVTYDID